MSIPKGHLFKIFIVLMLLMFTVACSVNRDSGSSGGNETSDGDSSEGKEETVEIEFAYMGEGETYELYKRMFKEYEEANPGVKITPSVIANEFNATILTRIAGGNAPDVFWISNEAVPSFAERNALLDLTPYDGQYFNSSEFMENSLAGYMWDGKIFGLPGDAATSVLFYNKNLFDQASVDYPEANMSWDQLLEKAKALTVTEGDNTTQYGLSLELSFFSWAPFVWSNGGEILNEDSTASAINTPESAEALNFIRDLMLVEKVAPNATTQKTSPSYQLFQDGKVAMYYGGAWVASTILRDTDFEWDVVQPPIKEEKAGSLAQGGFAIAQNTKHPEEAVEFLAWLSGEEGQTKKFEAGFAGLPTLNGLMDTEIATKGFAHPTFDISLDEIAKSTEYARVAPSSPYWVEVSTEMTKEIQLFWSGEQEAEETLANIEKKINEILSEQ